MRYIEIKGGIRVPLSFEERRIIKILEGSGSVIDTDLDERDRETARLMCSRGVLNMIENSDETITYTVNKLEEIWRD